MKKTFSIILAAALAISLAACDNNEVVNNENTEEYTETSNGILLRNVAVDSEEGQAVCNALSKYLDTFISADFESISAVLHDDDKVYFNFESDEQKSLYELIFPQIEYNFNFVSEHGGTYGVMTTITSPDMAEVYGALITENIDRNIEGVQPEMDKRQLNNERMRELLKSDELARRVEDLYIYVEYINGEYIPRCDAFLGNELVGGAVEAQSEITDVINEAVAALEK